jgi:hypothetical protein
MSDFRLEDYTEPQPVWVVEYETFLGWHPVPDNLPALHLNESAADKAMVTINQSYPSMTLRKTPYFRQDR